MHLNPHSHLNIPALFCVTTRNCWYVASQIQLLIQLKVIFFLPSDSCMATQLLVTKESGAQSFLGMRKRWDCHFQQQLQALWVIYDRKPGKVKSLNNHIFSNLSYYSELWEAWNTQVEKLHSSRPQATKHQKAVFQDKRLSAFTNFLCKKCWIYAACPSLELLTLNKTDITGHEPRCSNLCTVCCKTWSQIHNINALRQKLIPHNSLSSASAGKLEKYAIKRKTPIFVSLPEGAVADYQNGRQLALCANSAGLRLRGSWPRATLPRAMISSGIIH